MLEMSFIETPYGRIHVQQTGREKSIVWLHGFLENLNVFYPLVRAYPHPAHHILIDLPGYGESVPAKNFDFSMQQMAKAVEAVLSSLNVEKVHLVAHSMGGYIALQIAHLFPERIASILLLHSMASADSEQRKENRNRTIEVVYKEHQLLLNEFYKNWFFEGNRARFAEEIAFIKESAGKNISPQTMIKSLEAMRDRPSMIDTLKNRDFKLHYIIGRYDPLFAASELIAQAETLHAGYDVLELSGHMGYIEEKERSLACIAAFIESV